LTPRKLLIALAISGALVGTFGTSVQLAAADPRTLLLTLADGRQATITVDVPAGTPVEQIPLPADLGPVASVTDVTPPAAPPPPAATTPAPEAPAAQPDPAGPRRSDGSEEETPRAREKQSQPTTGSKPLAKDEGMADETPASDATAPAPAADPSLALPGPAPIGVPNFFIDKFRIPPFLLPIYQAAGIEYGVRWEVLAAINEIETDYGRNLNVSTAGAMGWMQFIPSSWKAYGVDANRDGRKDPYSPVDAIFAAARYLRAAGAEKDLRGAIFAYNHAGWYVDSVLLRAKLIGGLPTDLVGSLSGLTQGHFPVAAKARYAGGVTARDARRRVPRGQNAAVPIEGEDTRRSIRIRARAGSPVTAVQDGRIVSVGVSERLGKYVRLRDAYGNTYTYGHLKKVAVRVPVAKRRTQSKAAVARELKLPRRDPHPTTPASAGTQRRRAAASASAAGRRRAARRRAAARASAARRTAATRKDRLFAHPRRPAAWRAGGRKQALSREVALPRKQSLDRYFTVDYGLSRSDVVLQPLRKGRRVIAGTVLGRVGRTDPEVSPHLLFEIRPAGRGAPRIDPKPILDGWKLLESTAIYRAAGKNPFFGPDAKTPSIGQILLMSKEALQRRVLANPRVETYTCGRRDIRAGVVDRRVLAALEFLAASGMKPTVTSLRCGHGFYTASGNVSHHSSGNAVDIAAINGIPILGHQGADSITDLAVRRLLTLQGTMKPDQIITLMRYEGTDNTYAMGDHHDHIHLGFRPTYDPTSKSGRVLESVLKPGQWTRLLKRLGRIDNPTVSTQPSRWSLTVKRPRASRASSGD